jgi:hypothetical protein
MEIQDGMIGLGKTLPEDHHEERIDISKFKGYEVRFGLTADNHLCSKYYRADVLNALYDIWEKQGIKTVYQCGNMVDGEMNFNRYDLCVPPGVEQQVDYFIKHWPQRKGISTKFICGDDHEGHYCRNAGIDFGKMVMYAAQKEGRKDLEYLGYMEYDKIYSAKNGQCKMRLIHAGGGSSYATSYSVQKIVESYQGGEKPNVLLVGHFHKAEFSYPRDVLTVQAGCFLPATRIETDSGRVPIANIEVGDLVLTHEGRYRPVTNIMSRLYDGDFYRIGTGKSATVPSRGYVTATAEHPFLTLDGWKPARDLSKDDWLAVQASEDSGELIPYFRTVADSRYYRQAPEPVLDLNTHDAKVREFLQQSYNYPPWLKKIPLDAVKPDAIVVDWSDRKVIAIELENGRRCPNNPRKYDLIPGVYDRVEWICTGKSGTYSRREYEVKDGRVYVQIKCLDRLHYSQPMKVYNLSVEEDESYIAGFHMVHNCTQDQTPFMRKKRIQAMVGGWTISFTIDNNGIVHNFTPQFHAYYDRAFYRNWEYLWK